MAEYIIHDGSIVLNRIKADKPMPVGDGKFCVEAVGEWDGHIGQAVDANGVVPDPAPAPPTTEDQMSLLKNARDAALSAMVHNFGDGRIIQVRPTDLSNVQIAISEGVDREWVMADNTVDAVTVVELQTALASGISQGKAIWDDYIAALKLL